MAEPRTPTPPLHEFPSWDVGHETLDGLLTREQEIHVILTEAVRIDGMWDAGTPIEPSLLDESLRTARRLIGCYLVAGPGR